MPRFTSRPRHVTRHSIPRSGMPRFTSHGTVARVVRCSPDRPAESETKSSTASHETRQPLYTVPSYEPSRSDATSSDCRLAGASSVAVFAHCPSIGIIRTVPYPGLPPSPSSLIVLPSGSSAQCRTQACLRRRLRSLSFHRDHPHSAVPRLAQRHRLGVSGRWASAGGHSALRQLGWRF